MGDEKDDVKTERQIRHLPDQNRHQGNYGAKNIPQGALDPCFRGLLISPEGLYPR
jgi:hypothetical protein